MNVWVEAARPRTLTAGIVPVLVGTASADRLIWWRFLAALTVGAFIQVGVNYANDYFDGIKGVDAPDRIGPRRATATGLVAPPRMRTAMIMAFAIAALAGAALALATTPLLLIVGLAALAAALGYSGGPKPYASAGLGELFVFVFFGVIATVGSAFVQDERIAEPAVVASIPVGLLAVAILVVNNLRDLRHDERAGKLTLAVRMRERPTRVLFAGLVIGAFALTPPVALVAGNPWPLLALASLPLGLVVARKVARAAAGPELAAALGATARLHLVFGVLLAGGLWIS